VFPVESVRAQHGAPSQEAGTKMALAVEPDQRLAKRGEVRAEWKRQNEIRGGGQKKRPCRSAIASVPLFLATTSER